MNLWDDCFWLQVCFLLVGKHALVGNTFPDHEDTVCLGVQDSLNLLLLLICCLLLWKSFQFPKLIDVVAEKRTKYHSKHIWKVCYRRLDIWHVKSDV